jgi:hypothetical protein
MTQNLTISGREYRASAEIARSFEYTPDYVSRLAREGKIVATNVNRKWFIDVVSFEEFVLSTDLQKEARSEELKKLRRVDRLLHTQEVKQHIVKDTSRVHIAVAESFAVLMCGAFVGLLGWSVSGADVTPSDLATGFENAYTQIADALTPSPNLFNTFTNWSVVASVQEPFAQQDRQPQVVPEQIINNPVSGNSEATTVPERSTGMHFSDEVDVRFVEDGTGVVRPVFRDMVDGKEYQMLLTPVTDGG